MITAGRDGRVRLAWAVLLSSLFICVVVTVAVPLGVRAFVESASRPMVATVQANQGTVGIDDPGGQRRAVLAGELPQEVEEAATILTDTTASALITIVPPDSNEVAAQLQISSLSNVSIDRITTPRFGASDRPNRLDMALQSGRVRLDIPESGTRQLLFQLETPHSTVEIGEPGRYTVEVSNDNTQITVQDRGMASVVAMDEALTLQPGERAEVGLGQPPEGPLDPARNLITNGDFSQGLDNWSLFAWQVEREDQPQGTTEVRADNGDPMLRFLREGIGHADVKVSQSINADVSDAESLRLLLTLRVLDHSLGVCGVQGSECPLFVIINYIDESGVSRVWQHGFFANGIIDDNLTPGACVSCAVVQQPHERVPVGQLYFYDVDLREELARQGFLPPRLIESISLVGSGHSFDTEVSDVSIIIE